MDTRDIAPADLATLTAAGYTETDLSHLAETEVQSLLPAKDGGGSDNDTDPHAAAAAEQDAAVAAAATIKTATEQGAGEKTVADSQSDETEDAGGNVSSKPDFVPSFAGQAPEGADEKIKTLRAEERAQFKQLIEGVISPDKYQETRDRTESEIESLRTAQIEARVLTTANAQMQQQSLERDWRNAQAAAMATYKAEGLDYTGKPALLAAYNSHLTVLGKDPKNANRDAPWFLNEAHRLTKDDLGIQPSAKKSIPGRVDSLELPPTLRNVPASATGAVNSDEFAHIRNLDGIELERAHAKLTPEQRDRWMAE